MGELIAAVAVFIISHMIPMRPNIRQPFERRFGVQGFLVGYSLLSLLIIYWLASAFVRAPYIELWPWSKAAAWMPVVLMPLACVLIFAGLTSKNPFSLGLGANDYDPAHPGIVSVTRHPAMWGLVIWSGSHVPVNGDVAGLILFTLMLLLSLAGTYTLEKTRRRKIPPALWQRWRQGSVNIPFTAFNRIDWRGIGWWRLAGGLAFYLMLLFAHQPVIGVPPPLFY